MIPPVATVGPVLPCVVSVFADTAGFGTTGGALTLEGFVESLLTVG